MKKIVLVFLAFLHFTLNGCSKNEPMNSSSEKKIISFYFQEYKDALVSINEQDRAIIVSLPTSANVSNLTPVFSLSDKSTIYPTAGKSYDFTYPQKFTVYAEDGTFVEYQISVKLISSEKNIISISTQYHDGVLSGTNITFNLPYGTDVRALKMLPMISVGAVATPDIAQPQDYTQPLICKITAEDGSTKDYKITVNIKPQETAVRAVWLPSAAHTTSFMSYANVQASINLLDELNFNTLYVCAWANGKTCFDSDVLNQNSTWGSARNGNFYAGYTGGSGDALADIISVAHSKGIKVILWYEYGFMADWKAKGTGGVTIDNRIYAKHPEWIGISSTGEQANYNGTDYYFNSYDPAVQNFMISMMEESLTKYPDLDGIQGDDRMPAAPRNSGYEPVTKSLYRTEFGVDPPLDFQNPQWVRWRLDRLNAFGRNMYARIKAKKPSAIVCFSPNKYPWCEANLMQEWPQWIKDGIVQILSVQCYVKPNYASDVASSIATIQATGITKSLLNPGMILKNGNTLLTEQELVYQLKINRQYNTNGEAQFWFEGLKEPYIQTIFKAFYPAKAIFPAQ